MKTLQEQLRIKAGIMEMGEKIAWGSDTSLMRLAADRIDALEQAIKSNTEKMQRVRAFEFQIGEEI
jgi:cob(I)alamin adenosyltransferase